MNYIRETPYDDSMEIYREHKFFMDQHGREPFDDNELFLFIEEASLTHAESIADWEE